jgi:hypothetical protein
MPITSRAKIPYPSEHKEPWFDQFVEFAQAIDSAVYAEREDRALLIMGGGLISWNAGTGVLSWADTLEFPAAPVGFLWRVAPGSIVVSDGQFVYFQAVRSPTNNLNVVLGVGSQVPATPSEDPTNSVLFGVRRGTRIYFRNGDVIQTGESSNLFESSGASLTVSYATPTTLDGAAGSGGVSLQISAADHKHPLDMAEVGDIAATGTANGAGVSNEVPRADHVHRTELRVQSAGSAVGQRPTINFLNGVVADDGGNDRVNITAGVGATGETLIREFDMLLDQDTDLSGFVAAGGRRFNPANHALTNTTRTVYFFADAYVTGGGLTGEIQLYDLTSASVVALLSFVGTVSPTHQETAVVLTLADRFYEVRYRVTGGVGPGDRVFAMVAGLKVVNTVN